jgi:hypothetical protein
MARISTVLLRPPVPAAGIKSFISSHWLSVKSVGYDFFVASIIGLSLFSILTGYTFGSFFIPLALLKTSQTRSYYNLSTDGSGKDERGAWNSEPDFEYIADPLNHSSKSASK